MSALARATEISRRIGWTAWLVIAGSVGIVLGSLAQSAAGTLNVNGGLGGWPILLLGAVTAGVADAVVPSRPALARWRDVPIGIAVGALAVAFLDLAELGRGVDEVILGGWLGGIGRVLAAGSAAGLLAGLLVRRRAGGGPSWIAGLRSTSRYHLARLGGTVVVVAWVVLVTGGQGFALRTIDALALLAVAVIVTGLGTTALVDPSDRSGRVTLAVLAAVTVVVGLDTVLVVLGHLGSIASDGPATFGGYAVYLAGVVLVGLGGVNATIGLRRPRRVVTAPA